MHPPLGGAPHWHPQICDPAAEVWPANSRRISSRRFAPSEKRRPEMRLLFAGY